MNNTDSYTPENYAVINCDPISNQIIEVENDSHLQYLLHQLNKFRITGILCNCILATTDGASFRAHKVVLSLCSNYFRTLFTTSLTEMSWDDTQSSEHVYCIPDVSADILASIVDFAYSGIVHIDAENVCELLKCADQYDVTGIVNECVDFLLKSMTAENCLGIWRFGKEYFIPPLEIKARRYILENFVEIMNTEEFFQLKINQLKDILEDDALNVSNENFVWIAVKNWCQHKQIKREKYIACLLPCVRLALLSFKHLKEIMEDPRVFKHFQCRSYINMVSKYFFNQLPELSQCVQDNNIVSMFTPRYPNEVIVACGGWTIRGPTNDCEVYDNQANLWKMITFDNFGPRAYHQTVCLGEYIYIIGGISGHDHLSSCCRFSVTTLTFEEISPMHKQRCFLSATILNEKIYAIGGFDGQDRLESVEFYNEEENQWIYISSMKEKRSDARASSLRNRIFVVGGYNGQCFLQSAECYFAEFDQWFFLPSMVRCRSGVGCMAMDDAVYAIGGYDGENRLKSVEKYCLFQSQWFATKPMKQPRSNFAVAVIDKKIYVMGGYDDVADDTTDQAEYFDLLYPGWYSAASLNIGRSGFSACTVSGMSRIRPYIEDDSFRCLLKNIPKEQNMEVEITEVDDTSDLKSDVPQNVFV